MDTAFEVYILQKGNTLHKKVFFLLIKNQLILILTG